MAKAKVGDTVSVHYTGKLADGTVFDSSQGNTPLKFLIGEGRLIKGFENAVLGLTPGESQTVQITADDAYGPYDDRLVQSLDRKILPDEIDPQVGQRLEAVQDDGSKIQLFIKEVNEHKVTLDANHPLAGEDLLFEIELVEIDG